MRIVEVKAYPLAAPLTPELQRTAAGDRLAVSLLVVEILTDDGITGWGEGLLRAAPAAAAALVERSLAPLLLGADPFAVEALWMRLARIVTGRAGGLVLETLAAIDIALWDIMGKATGLPVHRLLGSCDRSRVAAYASAITWGPIALAEAQLEEAIRRGFPLIKVKLGAPVGAAIERMRVLSRQAAGRARLCADANWAFDCDDAVRLARALLDLDVEWLEEPIIPEDIEGYRRLRAAVPIRLAAGESDFTAWGARDLIAARVIGIVQPDVARAGGITETRRIATLAHCFHVAYAPHVGFSGAICAAASLQLAAAMPNFLTYECMIFPNPLREELATTSPADPRLLQEGCLPVPQAPGLGIEIDRAALLRFATA